MHRALTDIRSECDRPRENKEERVGKSVYNVSPVYLAQRPYHQRAQAEAHNEKTNPKDRDFLGYMKICRNACLRE